MTELEMNRRALDCVVDGFAGADDLLQALRARIAELEAAKPESEPQPSVLARLVDRVTMLEAKETTRMNVEAGLTILGDQFQEHHHHMSDAGRCYW